MNTQFTADQIAEAARAQAKKMGISSRKISITRDHSQVTIQRKQGLEMSAFESICKFAKEMAKVDYCQASGELLAGANVYISIIRN